MGEDRVENFALMVIDGRVLSDGPPAYDRIWAIDGYLTGGGVDAGPRRLTPVLPTGPAPRRGFRRLALGEPYLLARCARVLPKPHFSCATMTVPYD
jgi:hypothetical protein